jgi:hypothetical protein
MLLFFWVEKKKECKVKDNNENNAQGNKNDPNKM